MSPSLVQGNFIYSTVISENVCVCVHTGLVATTFMQLEDLKREGQGFLTNEHVKLLEFEE